MEADLRSLRSLIKRSIFTGACGVIVKKMHPSIEDPYKVAILELNEDVEFLKWLDDVTDKTYYEHINEGLEIQ